jgi:hypothetical protein
MWYWDREMDLPLFFWRYAKKLLLPEIHIIKVSLSQLIQSLPTKDAFNLV